MTHRVEHLAEGVTLWLGDCLEVLRELEPNSIDACVTDPPYGLGFMGKAWDRGVPGIPYWKAVYRVLKPGAHLLAFGGTRTFGRMHVAIEDAGFEIRDMVAWLYGSGFPKSLDVSKAIDKRPGVPRHAEFAAHLKSRRHAAGFSNSFDVSERVTGRRTGACANWEKYQFPEAQWWPALRDLLALDPAWGAVIAEAERQVIGNNNRPAGWFTSQDGHDITIAETTSAREWQGFGTALKPACEPIVLARKPLEGTVAQNVLKWGTGALNIDGCRVATGDKLGGGMENGTSTVSEGWDRPWRSDPETIERNKIETKDKITKAESLGRWPANVIHDGSEEVLAAFPDAPGQGGSVSGGEPSSLIANVYGDRKRKPSENPRNDSGSAARFFYTAKADADDRLGSKHPTVKPLDLMQYLVRLVTPPGGLVLDPFAGTGTTGEAAWREKMRAVLIEREPEYQDDIRRRMRLAMCGLGERSREGAKARNKDKPVDHGPLFGGSEMSRGGADRFTDTSPIRTDDRTDRIEKVSPK